MSSVKSVLFAIPCYGGMLNCATAGSLFWAGKLLDNLNIPNAMFCLQNESFVPTARNVIAQQFMASDFTHLMCIDADIGFNPDDIIKLVQMDNMFSAGAYRVKTDNTVRFACNGFDPESKTAESVGLGFALLSRDVFTKIQPCTDKLNTQEEWGLGVEQIYNYYAPLIIDFNMFPEDLSFCLRCKRVEIPIHVDPEISLWHIGSKAYTGRITDACNSRLDI